MPAPSPVKEKLCTGCDKILPRDAFFLYVPKAQKRNTPRMSHLCKPCANKHTHKLILANTTAWKNLAGGRCLKCGYDKCQGALDFHHRDPSTKTMNLATKTGGVGPDVDTKNSRNIRAEVAKCDLLCANCHREVHHALKSTV